MASNLSNSAVAVIAEERRPKARMAKVGLGGLRKSETSIWPKAIGAAIQRALSLVGWSLKEFSAAVGRDERQCARWIAGEERAQLDTMFAVEALRQPLVQALAELAEAEVIVTVRLKVRQG